MGLDSLRLKRRELVASLYHERAEDTRLSLRGRQQRKTTAPVVPSDMHLWHSASAGGAAATNLRPVGANTGRDPPSVGDPPVIDDDEARLTGQPTGRQGVARQALCLRNALVVRVRPRCASCATFHGDPSIDDHTAPRSKHDHAASATSAAPTSERAGH